MVPKFAGLAGSSKCRGEVTWVASLPVRPAVPLGPDSSHPAAPFLLEECFPALSKNEEAGACQGALEDGLRRGTAAAGSCSHRRPDELRVTPQLHPIWSYKCGFVVVATQMGGWHRGSDSLRFALPGIKSAKGAGKRERDGGTGGHPLSGCVPRQNLRSWDLNARAPRAGQQTGCGSG